MFPPIESHEGSLAKALDDYGPLIAIGRPNEILPSAGAYRLYTTHEHWQQVVQKLAGVAQFVVLQDGPSEGLLWEIKHVFSHLPPDRVLLFAPAADDEPVFETLSDQLDRILARPLRHRMNGAVFVGFTNNWEPVHFRNGGPGRLAILRCIPSFSRAPVYRDALNFMRRQRGLPTQWLEPTFFETCLLASLAVVAAKIVSSLIH